MDCVASGYQNFDLIKFKVRKGRFHIIGLGFSNEENKPVAGMAVVHSDNVFGDPASLSDTRLKQNQALVPTATLAATVEAVSPMVYDLISTGVDTDGQPLPAERRVGFIADDIKTVLPADWTNVVGSKPVNDDEFLTLDYSRLACVLWGTVKELRARVSALEA